MNLDPATIRTIDELNDSSWNVMLKDPAKAADIATHALDLSRRCQYDKGRASALLNSAWCHLFLSDLSGAESIASEALELYNTMDNLLGLSLGYNLMGSVFHQRGDFDKALEWFMKSLEIAKSLGRKDREAAALNNVGEVLKDSGEIQEALTYFMRASEAMKAMGDEKTDGVEIEPNVLVNIGESFLALGETENASSYLELALDSAEAVEDAGTQARTLKALAHVAKRRGSVKDAQDLFSRALEIAQSSGQVLIASEAMTENAELLIETGNLTEALRLLELALETTGNAGAKRNVPECYRLRSLAREYLGDIASALADYKRYKEALDDLSDERVARLVHNAEARYELESAKKEAEIFRLRNVELKERRAELERTNARLHAVTEIGREITASLDMETVARIVHRRLGELLDATDFSLALLDSATDRIVFRLFIQGNVESPVFSIPADSKDSFSAWVIAHGEPLLIKDAPLEYGKYINASGFRKGTDTSSLLFTPLFSGSRVVGAIGIQSMQPQAYSGEDLKLIGALASFVSVALENSRVHEELRKVNLALQTEKSELERLTRKVSHIANHDGLTGLPNRLLLAELLDTALKRSRRVKKLVAVMYMDLDDFKPINDKYGHRAGDIALVVVSNRLKQVLRASDTVARVGGDEFVAIVTDLDSKLTASLVADKLVVSCSQPMDVGGTECRVGVSVGIAFYPDDGVKAEELLRHADDALYQVKRRGKNGFAFYNGNETRDEEPKSLYKPEF